jgi:hypothetical protein
MATAREHLAEGHEKSKTHHLEMEKHHREMAKLHHALHKPSGMAADQDGPHAQLAMHHYDIADLHKAKAAYHAGAAEACAKGMDSGDLNKLAPIGISGVTPNNPNRVTPVPRFGQPVPAKMNVDPQFEKMFAVDDAEEERSVTKSIG